MSTYLGRSFLGRVVRRRGMTLVEILVAMALSLMLVAALAQAFQFIGVNVADGRARLNMANEMRGATRRLQNDLEGITVPLAPWTKEASGQGYFELIEGRTYDSTNVAADTLVGDFDDILAFTARTTGPPFRGRLNGAIIESDVAEIIWWTSLEDENGNGSWDAGEDFFLHRRALLIRPDLNAGGMGVGAAFFQNNDLSARQAGGNMAANSLSDLTQRENRFAHNATTFPFLMNRNGTTPLLDTSYVLTGANQGEDVILSHVLAFDVRVFDPQANVKTVTFTDSNSNSITEIVSPGDAKYAVTGTTSRIGAFVDLGIADGTIPVPGVSVAEVPTFGMLPQNSALWGNVRAYCTWSTFYEHNGSDEDADGTADEAEDGLDNDGVNGVDDAGERETSPPYATPLRGIRVSFRTVDHTSRQVRQGSVTQRFTSE